MHGIIVGVFELKWNYGNPIIHVQELLPMQLQ